MISSKPEIPHIPYRDEVRNIFPEDLCKNMNWNSEGDTFPLFPKLLAYPGYSYDVLFGLIISVGGLTEGLVSIH